MQVLSDDGLNRMCAAYSISAATTPVSHEAMMKQRYSMLEAQTNACSINQIESELQDMLSTDSI